MMGFVDKLHATLSRNESLLCVGLDPDPARIPAHIAPGTEPAERVRRFCDEIVAQTADLVCCYKPNFAFFEQIGPEGLAAMREVIAGVPDGIPVILDAKRGDIGSTATAYARAAFEIWGADAITASPYLGQDSIAPFLTYDGKMVFVLCQTSNPSAGEIQSYGAPPLFEHVVTQAQQWGDTSQIAYVVGATQPDALAAVRRLAPERWILAPGIGAQGGDLEAALSAGLRADGAGVIVPVSRGVLNAQDPRAAALDLRERINAARRTATASPDALSHLARLLFETGCVRFGQFTLASGAISPVYVDLRRVISFPTLFQAVAQAYAALLRPLSCDLLAAVPYAALPACSAVALTLGKPAIYPRKEAKAHGTGQLIEGAWNPGQQAVVIEDVITSGGSLLQAIDVLEAAGLQIEDVVVLVDREQGGRELLAQRGYRLHAVLTLRGLLDELFQAGLIDSTTHRTVIAYLTGAGQP